MNTPKNTATKSFVKNILSTPSFVEQMAAKQRIIAAKGAKLHSGKGVLE
jgi:hypothetical protein